MTQQVNDAKVNLSELMQLKGKEKILILKSGFFLCVFLVTVGLLNINLVYRKTKFMSVNFILKIK